METQNLAPVGNIKQESDKTSSDDEIHSPISSGLIKQEPEFDDVIVKMESSEEEESDLPAVKMAPTSSSSLLHEDTFVYCGKCQMKYEEECPVHGFQVYIDNAETRQGEGCSQDFSPHVHDARDKDRRLSRKGKSRPPGVAHNDDLGTLQEGNCSSGSGQIDSVSDMNSDLSVAGTSCGLQSNFNFKSHEEVDNIGKYFACDLCGSDFTYCSHANSQEKAQTEDKPYKCNVCGIGFAERGNLRRHRRIHTGDKPYKCDLCGIGFAQSGHLKSHNRTHTREKPYTCDVCGVAFAESGHLKRHIRRHTGEKPYKCEVCGAAFTVKVSLNTHMRTHTGEKPYKCEVCGVGFSQSGGLKSHMRTHTLEKPYRCDVCGVGFAESGVLITHKRTHTGEKPFICDMCGVGFAQRGHLKGHKRTHLGLKSKP